MIDDIITFLICFVIFRLALSQNNFEIKGINNNVIAGASSIVITIIFAIFELLANLLFNLTIK